MTKDSEFDLMVTTMADIGCKCLLRQEHGMTNHTIDNLFDVLRACKDTEKRSFIFEQVNRIYKLATENEAVDILKHLRDCQK